MHLHNRQLKATFWNDPDLLAWKRDKRWFYEGLFHLADDSGCLENSTFAFKLSLFPSPMDADITMDLLAEWRDEIVHTRKLVPYKAEGKECLYISKFHKHQTLKNPELPDVPLPPWIEFHPFDSNPRTGKYKVSYEVLTEFLRSSDNVLLREEKRSQLEEKRREGEENGDSVSPSTVDEVAVSTTNHSTHSSSSLDHEFGRVVKMYEAEGFGQITETTESQLGALYDIYGRTWLIAAMEESVLQNKRRLAYVKSILSNWKTNGGMRRSGDVGASEGNSGEIRGIGKGKSITGGQVGWVKPAN